MHSLPFPQRSMACLIWLLTLFFFVTQTIAEENSPTFSARGPEVYLFTQPEEHSQAITKLEAGEKLVPIANALGRGEPWYMVRTAKGAIGWVKSSTVDGTGTFERIVRQNDSVTPQAVLPEAPAVSPSEKSIIVPVEMYGGNILVPVVLNGSLKTQMAMDTGATLTLVNSRIAKKLGLKSASRIPLSTVNGRISASLSRLASLKVGNAEVRGVDVTIHDFSPDPRIEGLLGLNFLSRFHTSIDSRQQRLILTPR